MAHFEDLEAPRAGTEAGNGCDEGCDLGSVIDISLLLLSLLLFVISEVGVLPWLLH